MPSVAGNGPFSHRTDYWISRSKHFILVCVVRNTVVVRFIRCREAFAVDYLPGLDHARTGIRNRRNRYWRRNAELVDRD